jgi:AcrR family transcriptional regulator
MANVSESDSARRRLLAAAEQVLLSDGFGALTTRRIARQAGVPGGLVHYHFGSLDRLSAELAEVVGRRLVEGQRAVFGAAVPWPTRWRAAALWASEAPTWTAWMGLRAAGPAHQPLRRAVQRVEREWQAEVARAVRSAGAELAPGQLPEAALVGVVSAVLHGVAEEAASGAGADHEPLVAWIEGLLVAAAGEPLSAG